MKSIKQMLRQVSVKLRLDDMEPLYSDESITTPEQATRIMADVLRELDREQVVVVNLDNKGHPINFNVVSIGNLTSSYLEPCQVFKSAILSNAASVIVLHNHPSGDVTPSKNDLAVTKDLVEAGALMHIPVLDHVIIAGRTGHSHSLLESHPDLFSESAARRLVSQVSDRGQSLIADAAKEEQLLYEADTGTMPVAIYQLPDDHIKTRLYRSMEDLKNSGQSVEPELYELVYVGDMPAGTSLDDIYTKFKATRPEGFTGHSLSVSDVIVHQSGEVQRAYYVDKFGFEELPGFMEKRRAMLEEGEPKEDKAETKQERARKQMQELTETLEQGVNELFQSDRYKSYLQTMSQFHQYSFNNSLLIFYQFPTASCVASFSNWKNKFSRHVKKGEHGIRIFAPSPYKVKVPKLDKSGQVIRKEDGSIVEVEVERMGFKVVSVFDVSQTEGKPLPSLTNPLSGTTQGAKELIECLKEISPVPIRFVAPDGRMSMLTEGLTMDDVRQKQWEIIQNTNQKWDGTQSAWIDTPEDARTFYEAVMEDTDYPLEEDYTEDFTVDDKKNILQTGIITVYSSKPVQDGNFVTPSRMEAQSYSGTGIIYSATMDVRDIAWLDVGQGQVAHLPDVYKEVIQQDTQARTAAPVTETKNLGNAYGMFSELDQEIYVRNDLSDIHTIKTMVHEIAHSLLHDKANQRMEGLSAENEDRDTKEIQSESVAYVVCQHFGIDTSEYSFGYIAGWSAGKSTRQLEESMQTIQKTANKVISDVETRVQELREQQALSQEQQKEAVEQLHQAVSINSMQHNRTMEQSVSRAKVARV